MINRKPTRTFNSPYATNANTTALNMFDNDDAFGQSFKTARNGATIAGAVIVLVALAFTIASIVLAVNVSPWFFIATAIAGGYTLIMGTIVIVQRVIMNSVGKTL